MKNIPHLILETANVHEGSPEILIQIIDRFSELEYPSLGIKYHPFNPDNVAMNDFSWYDRMKGWFISEESWGEIIGYSRKKNFSVWLDLFCEYGVRILQHHHADIEGIKLQPSVLDNREVFDRLGRLNLNHHKIILNIAGFEIDRISRWVKKYLSLDWGPLILQAGFQRFPTDIRDSSIGKIDVLKKEFPELSLAYADHLKGGSRAAVQFPSHAFTSGCDFIEKHVCLDRESTPVDGDSALELCEVKELAEELINVAAYFSASFLSENEKTYLKNTLQKAVVSHPLNMGQIVASGDVVFRRTDRDGMAMAEVEDLQKNYFLLNRPKKQWDTLEISDFSQAKIGVIVACRMKSSRLKRKALRLIGGIPAIERCLGNCLDISMSNKVILATSDLDEDTVLADHLLGGKVTFWTGDPDDVISRYLGACEKYKLDVVVRVTGDSPAVSSEIAEILIESHFAAGADFTKPEQFAIGTNCEVYNVETLNRIRRLWGRAEYSEHMTLYVTNNPHLFKINTVKLSEDMVRDYRLTLDYPEDLEMFNRLFQKLDEEKLNGSLGNVFGILDENPDIAGINSHLRQIYHTDGDLGERLKKATTRDES